MITCSSTYFYMHSSILIVVVLLYCWWNMQIMPILAQVLMVGWFDLIIHQQQLQHVKSQHIPPEMSCTDIMGEKGLQSKGRDCRKVLQGKAIPKQMVKRESKPGLARFNLCFSGCQGPDFVSAFSKARCLPLIFSREVNSWGFCQFN